MSGRLMALARECGRSGIELVASDWRGLREKLKGGWESGRGGWWREWRGVGGDRSMMRRWSCAGDRSGGVSW